MKSRVHVGVLQSLDLNLEEVCLFEGSGLTMGHIKNPALDTINQEKLVKLIKMNNKKAVCQQCLCYNKKHFLFLRFKIVDG
jgi:hypothetical protein